MEFTLKEQIQNTRVWFFIRGMSLLFFAALAALGVFQIVLLLKIFAVFSIVSGLITIIMSLTNSLGDKRYRNFGLLVGLIHLMIGLSFMLWPYLFTKVWLVVFVIDLMLDGLFVASALLSVKEMGASKWWSIIGGLTVFTMGMFVVFRILAFPFAPGQMAMTAEGMLTFDISNFALYLFIAGMFFFITTIVINPENIATSVVKKETKAVAKKSKTAPAKEPAKTSKNAKSTKSTASTSKKTSTKTEAKSKTAAKK